MAKRKVIAIDSGSDFGDADADSTASSSSEFVEETKKRKQAGRTVQKPVKKRNKKKQHDLDEEIVRPSYNDKIARPHPVSLHVIDHPEPLRASLLDWYANVHETRGMPWRKPYDPTLGPDERAQRAYEVWVSEIMLQQTQVATVIPYYNKWMARFPTIRDLATSDIETVNSLWKGLGYYSRAARLLSGAKRAIEEFGGRLPDNAKDMESKIPGIGRYSAGAICSIAYNHCVPVLDGNVNRLMSRLLVLHASPKAKTTLDILWTGAEAMVKDSEHPGDINQALIELGATICRVRDPACGTCPLNRWCNAYRLATAGQTRDLVPEEEVPDIEELCTLCEPLLFDEPNLVTHFPMKAERKKAREELDIVNVVEWRKDQDRYFLLVRRPEGGLLGGLHEFPTRSNVSLTISATEIIKIPHTILSNLLVSDIQPYVSRADSKLAESFKAFKAPEAPVTGLRVTAIRPAGDVIHVFSHVKKTYRVQWVLLEGGGDLPSLNTEAPPVPTAQRVRDKNKTKNKPAIRDRVRGSTEVRWLKLEDVEGANIGIGVLKTWKQVQALWRAS